MSKKISLMLVIMLALSIITMPSYAAPYSGYKFLYEDFEEKAESAVGRASADYKASVDGYANSSGSLEVTLTDDGQMIFIPVSLKEGETYNISCYIKPHDDVKANYVNFIFWLKQKMDDGTAGNAEGFSTARINGVNFKAGEWTYVSTKYTFSGQANINGKMTDAVGNGNVSIRFGGGTLKEINSKSEFTYNIDDFCIEPLLNESEVKEPYEKINILQNGDFSSETCDEWIAYNAEKEITDDVPAEGCDSVNSIHVTQTLRAGKVYQNISVKPNTQYKLSFWCKGASAGKAIPSFEWDEGDKKIYEYMNGDTDLQFNDEWSYYELLHTTSADTPTSVRFYIYTTKLQKTDFYLTDIKIYDWPFDTIEIDDESEITTPEIREIYSDGYLINGNSISVNAEYLGPNPQSGLIQMFKQADDGGWASIKTAEFNGDDFTYTFKAADIGQNVKVRIVPMDIEGNVGGYRETELGVVHDIYEVNAKFLSGLSEQKIVTKTEITNWSGKDENIVCMVLLYDEDNCCIASNYKSCYTSFGDCNKLEVEVLNNGKCRKAKIFVWKGESDINTMMIPVVKCTTLTY